MIVMKHELHGIHFATTNDEADALEKRGWRRAPEENYRLDPSFPRPGESAQQPVLKLRKG